MANIEKPKFHILEVSGNNYLSWCLDMKMYLQGQDLANAITEDGTSNAKDKSNALIFIRSHLHESLQTPGPALRVGERGGRLGPPIFFLKNRPFYSGAGGLRNAF